MYDAIVLWIHILAAVIFIGPQIFLALAAVPAMQTIEDVKIRARAMRVMTMRFGILGGGALVVLLITGILNYAQLDHETDYKRYFITLQIKLTLVAVVVVLTILHGAVFGRRLQQLQEANAPDAEIAQARRLSMYASMGTLALSIIILLCAAILGSDWSTSGSLR